jgi:hypothetical protein
LSENKWQVGPVKLVNNEDAFIDAINEGQEAFRYTGRVKHLGVWESAGWDDSGRRMYCELNHPHNLAPPPKKTVRVRFYINVYSGGAFHVHLTRVDAKSGAGANRIAYKEIDIEVEEGEGL